MTELRKPVPADIVESQEPKPLIPTYAALVFFHSFRHSQGMPALQEGIFHYLKYANPHWTMSPEQKVEMQTIAKRKIENHLFGKNGQPKQKYIHTQLTPTKSNEEILEMSKKMQQAFNNGKGYSHNQLIMSIIEMMTERDAKFLFGGGIPNAGNQVERERFIHESTNPLLDKNLSFLCYYGLAGNTTGIVEIDEMYKDLTSYLRTQGTSGLSRETDAQFDAVTRFYNNTHPNNQVNLSLGSLSL